MGSVSVAEFGMKYSVCPKLLGNDYCLKKGKYVQNIYNFYCTYFIRKDRIMVSCLCAY
jgi:hypothetical protein